MKKLITLFLLIGAGYVHAQGTKRGYIGIGLGAAIPTGDYASTDDNNQDAGYAKTGSFVEIVKFGYKLNSHVGVAGSWYGLVNSTDAQARAAGYQKRLPGTSGSVEFDNWTAGGLLGGLLVSFDPAQKLSLDFTAMLGFISASSPVEKVTIKNAGGAVISQFSVASQTEKAIAFKLGGDLRFRVSEKWALTAGLNYLFTSLDYNSVEVRDANGNVIGHGNFTQPIHVVGITGGLVYLLK